MMEDVRKGKSYSDVKRLAQDRSEEANIAKKLAGTVPLNLTASHKKKKKIMIPFTPASY